MTNGLRILISVTTEPLVSIHIIPSMHGTVPIMSVNNLQGTYVYIKAIQNHKLTY